MYKQITKLGKRSIHSNNLTQKIFDLEPYQVINKNIRTASNHSLAETPQNLQLMPKQQLRMFSVSSSKREKILNNTITKLHQNALKHLKALYTFSIRETGSGSIRRINEGAKPKPHSILEKSIKPESINTVYIDKEESKYIQEIIRKKNIDGFVGHWKLDENGKPRKLLGVRTDGYKGSAQKLMEKIDGSENGLYLPLSEIDKFKKQNDDWKTYLYTGDYDLHEVYDNSNKQIPEGEGKARMLNRLNKAISNLDESRVGVTTFDPRTHRVHVKGEYAMFQHGDQATYVTNQHNEARENEVQNGKGNYATHISHVAKIVKGVAAESDGPLTWYHQGNFYVTLNKSEHNQFRKLLEITASSEWTKNIKKLRDRGLRLTEESDHGYKKYSKNFK